jgi:tRNA pseudouridine38-40 synthase
MASRTDAGVNVRQNGGIVDMKRSKWDPMGEKGFMKAVRDRLPGDMAFFDAMEVEENWLPRRNATRTYLYRLEGVEKWRQPEVNDFKNWCQIFVGEHNWSNFSRVEEGKTYNREVLECEPWLDGTRIIGFKIVGTAFVWNQVRRIASALLGLSNETYTVEKVTTALHQPNQYMDLGLCPPDWLTLWDVEWHHIPPISAKIPVLTKPNGIFKRWRELAKLEQKQMLHASWSITGS